MHSGRQMQIILVRHGRPLFSDNAIRASQFGDCLQNYNSAPLDPASPPPTQLIELAQHCGKVFCSDLSRSRLSAQWLLASGNEREHAIFREMELPYANFPSPKLSPYTWIIVFRVLWLLGYKRKCESARAARQRAVFAARYLQHEAQQLIHLDSAHGAEPSLSRSMMLVGHGLLNRFIAKQLRKDGWHGPTSIGSQFWAYSVFKKAL